jgi:hypothetical protein
LNDGTKPILRHCKEKAMSDVVYVSKSRIERKLGPLRVAYLPGESQPVIFSVHGAIAEHYKVDPAKLRESHSSTIDYRTLHHTIQLTSSFELVMPGAEA